MCSRPELSVVVPLFNEAESVVALHGKLRSVLGPDAEIVLVDDGSTDGTRQMAVEIEAEDQRTRTIGFRRNYGKSQALSAGFRRARGGVVVMLDGDLQDEPSEIPRLVSKLESGYDLVGGWRRQRRDPFLKRLGSFFFNCLVSWLGGTRFRDINSGLKAFRREVVDDVVLATGFHRFLPLLAHWRGFRVCEVPVKHHPRAHGRSRYGRDRVPRALMDLVVVLFLVRFEGRPGRYFVTVGGLMGLAGLLISCYILYLRFVVGSIYPHHPLMAFGLVLIVVGLQLVSMGFFSELLAYQFRSKGALEPAVWEGGADEKRESDHDGDAV